MADALVTTTIVDAPTGDSTGGTEESTQRVGRQRDRVAFNGNSVGG